MPDRSTDTAPNPTAAAAAPANASAAAEVVKPVRQPRTTTKSEAAFARAKQVMPGGVSSPVRSFRGVGGTPAFIAEGAGCTVKDLDGNTYVDYVGSYGPLIVGHANERVIAALSKAIGRGTSFGMPTDYETQLATRIASALPAVEMVRFVNSGTEAAMSAIRLARAATGRDLIVKLIGGYHGHVDGLLVEAGSGALTLGAPSTPGVPKGVAAATVLCHYNDLDGARAVFEQYPGQVACFCVEPVAGNMGCVPPADGYLQGLRALCDSARRAAAVRRGDDRVPGRVGRGAGAVRRAAGPDVPREGDRRRHPVRRVRRPAAPDGAGQPGRHRVPGRDAEREPAGDGRRDGHARDHEGARRVRHAREAERRAGRRASGRRPEGRRPDRPEPRRVDAHARSS
jgi:hypothetical protein